MSAPVAFSSPSAAFFAGAKTAVTSVFMLVLAGTYIGIGALTHDFGLSSWWLATSTVLVWAAPAQVILITTVTTGAALFEIALAVTLSAVRLFPMVVALMRIASCCGAGYIYLHIETIGEIYLLARVLYS